MLAELGHFSLVLALLMAMLLSVYPMWGAYKNQIQFMALAKPLAIGMFLFTAIAFGALMNAFYNDDFSIAYVANHSNSLLPWYYKLTAVWGGHEGSFLLWILIFSVWTVAVAVLSNSIPQVMVARVLSILGMVAVGFYLFVLTASNPFESLLPFYPVDGRDLNPLLQDFGMIIHPPMLYMGYVGFSVAFAFAISALISGQLDSTWARWSRPWTLAAWCFLTVGIALGSWWAYYELGWGGWWFWDPVENASFMPWLVGTALVHSLAVTEKRKIFKSWTVLLAISAFSLSLLGTFLVRSGVLVSVHSFASDPTRGLFILAILGVVVGGSLILYAIRAPQLKSVGRYEWFSREVMLMGNNLLLTAATIVVLMGTLLPLVHKEIGLGSISIGAPFFNDMFVYLIVPFVLLLAMGPLSRWKKQSPKAIQKQLLIGFVISVCGGFLIQASYNQMTYMATLGSILSVWIFVSTVQEIMQRVAAQNDKTQSSTTWQKLRRLTPSHWGMVMGHVGFAVTLIGITLVSNYEQERDVRMHTGDVIEISGYVFKFTGVRDLKGPNYVGHVGIVDVFTDTSMTKKITHLEAEKRFYPVQRTSMTEAGIDSGISRDLFVALGEQLNDGAWAVRIYIKPFVNWIWAGSLIMALGGILSISDKRYRMAKVAKVKKRLGGDKLASDASSEALATKVQGQA
ncbi:heme lyase CcmF/NrfE family subunit [Aliiglaciecola sp. 3_MG-2023]|uniref:heme lyase CcmF/NrfE family subunit n=1 Tax=Aliiglaciecola sp. 3_MG-2023 TaxID=3062644 RepID=UPI0026E369FE|nr:heme lyase CcmF/NrfE family subunit [Aliiglaciecola sp. 3_MG-2023]MDO6692707.1 heme lyase CcmF/NrfE family subunit [Aliiglaciecola sp. 3_MG-2023]